MFIIHVSDKDLLSRIQVIQNYRDIKQSSTLSMGGCEKGHKKKEPGTKGTSHMIAFMEEAKSYQGLGCPGWVVVENKGAGGYSLLWYKWSVSSQRYTFFKTDQTVTQNLGIPYYVNYTSSEKNVNIITAPIY